MTSTNPEYQQLNELYSLYLQQDRVHEAVVVAQQMVDLDPAFANSWAALAKAKGAAHEPDAIGAARHAVALGPEEFFPHSVLANLALDLSLDREAYENAAWCVVRHPDLAAGHVIMARYYRHINNYQDAHRHATEGLRLDPTNLLALNVLARCELHWKRYEYAAHYAGLALEKRPNNVFLLMQLGEVQGALAVHGQNAEMHVNEMQGIARHLMTTHPDDHNVQEMLLQSHRLGYKAYRFTTRSWSLIKDREQARLVIMLLCMPVYHLHLVVDLWVTSRLASWDHLKPLLSTGALMIVPYLAFSLAVIMGSFCMGMFTGDDEWMAFICSSLLLLPISYFILVIRDKWIVRYGAAIAVAIVASGAVWFWNETDAIFMNLMLVWWLAPFGFLQLKKRKAKVYFLR